jgi:hypothetical protein
MEEGDVSMGRVERGWLSGREAGTAAAISESTMEATAAARKKMEYFFGMNGFSVMWRTLHFNISSRP